MQGSYWDWFSWFSWFWVVWHDFMIFSWFFKVFIEMEWFLDTLNLFLHFYAIIYFLPLLKLILLCMFFPFSPRYGRITPWKSAIWQSEYPQNQNFLPSGPTMVGPKGSSLWVKNNLQKGHDFMFFDHFWRLISCFLGFFWNDILGFLGMIFSDDPVRPLQPSDDLVG